MNTLVITNLHILTAYSDDEIHSIDISDVSTEDMYKIHVLHHKHGKVGINIGREIVETAYSKSTGNYAHIGKCVSISYDEDRMTVMGVDAAPLYYVPLESWGMNTPGGLIAHIKHYIKRVL